MRAILHALAHLFRLNKTKTKIIDGFHAPPLFLETCIDCGQLTLRKKR